LSASRFTTLSHDRFSLVATITILMSQYWRARRQNHRRQDPYTQPVPFHTFSSTIVVCRTDHDFSVWITAGMANSDWRRKNFLEWGKIYSGTKSKAPGPFVLTIVVVCATGMGWTRMRGVTSWVMKNG
jgi:hypothetical protein